MVVLLMTNVDVGQLAVRLLQKYGNDALALATRQADSYFKAGDAIRYADWCLVIGEIELLRVKFARSMKAV
jgi:hypothetical protein